MEPEPEPELSTGYQQGKLLTRGRGYEGQRGQNRFSTFVGGFPAVGSLPKWHNCTVMREFRTLAFWAGRNGPGRGLECPRSISGVVAIDEGGRSWRGGQRGKARVGTGLRKTWQPARFLESGWLLKARGDRIFSVGDADLWFASGSRNRAEARGPVSSFPGVCGPHSARGKMWASLLGAAKDLLRTRRMRSGSPPGRGTGCACHLVGSVSGPRWHSAAVARRRSRTHWRRRAEGSGLFHTRPRAWPLPVPRYHSGCPDPVANPKCRHPRSH